MRYFGVFPGQLGRERPFCWSSAGDGDGWMGRCERSQCLWLDSFCLFAGSLFLTAALHYLRFDLRERGEGKNSSAHINVVCAGGRKKDL